MTTKTNPARERIQRLINVLQARFVKRDEAIEAIVIAAIAGLNAVQLGPPGTAKTALATAFARGLGVTDTEHFSVLLTKFTAPEELFGPISFSALKADRYERITVGYLPSARTAFLDEIFKASPAVLNSLLTALNERRYRNGGEWQSMPLSFVLAASNEYPEGSHLGALWDRFQVRLWLDYCTASDRAAVRRADGDVGMEAIACLADLESAREEAAEISVPHAIDDVFARVLDATEKVTATPTSDRKLRQLEKAAKAAAWLRGANANGCTDVTPADCSVWRHMLWEHHDQRAAVSAEIDKICASGLTEARRLIDALNKLVGSIPNPDPIPDRKGKMGTVVDAEQVKTQLLQAGDQVKVAIKRLEAIVAEEASAAKILAEAKKHQVALRERYSTLAFGV